MTLNEYAKALKRAPEAYRKLEWGEVKVAIMGGKIIMCHKDHEPIVWQHKLWQKLNYTSEPEGEIKFKSYPLFKGNHS